MQISRLSKIGISATAALLLAGVQQSKATIYGFTDEAYASSSTTFHNAFGSTATGYTSAGYYQETQSTTPTIIRLGNNMALPGEFQENTPQNASQGIQLFGWQASLIGGKVDSVYNLNNPINGANTYFQYKTGVTGGLFGNGTTTAFTFNSFDLRGSYATINLSFTLEGFRNGNLVDSQVLNITGNTLNTYTFNWLNVDTVEIASTSDLPVNWGSGSLYMDNIRINESVPVPEPTTIVSGALLLLPFAAGAIRALKRNKA